MFFLLLRICFFCLITVNFCAAEKIEFIDAPVPDVLEVLTRQAGINLIISGDNNLLQNKKTSLRLNNVSPREVLETVLSTNGLRYEKKGNTLMVTLSGLQNDSPMPGMLQTVNLKYLSATRVCNLLEKMFPNVKMTAGERASSLILQGAGSACEDILKLITTIDKPIPQILIESKVVEVSGSMSSRLGVSYGGQGSGIVFITSKDDGQTKLAQDFITTINALINEGQAKVIATPKIATLDNHEAVINIGSRVPYAVPVSNNSGSNQWSVEYIDAGVKLKITPFLGQEGVITAAIQPEVSAVSEWRITAAGEFPVITTRNAQATLRVKEGETIMVGGLCAQTERESIVRIPFLGDIPGLGELFKNRVKEKTDNEIVFLITPHLV